MDLVCGRIWLNPGAVPRFVLFPAVAVPPCPYLAVCRPWNPHRVPVCTRAHARPGPKAYVGPPSCTALRRCTEPSGVPAVAVRVLRSGHSPPSPRLAGVFWSPKWPSAAFGSCGAVFGKIIYCGPWEQDLMLIHLGYGTYPVTPRLYRTWVSVLALPGRHPRAHGAG